jgi:hypothetical protein
VIVITYSLVTLGRKLILNIVSLFEVNNTPHVVKKLLVRGPQNKRVMSLKSLLPRLRAIQIIFDTQRGGVLKSIIRHFFNLNSDSCGFGCNHSCLKVNKCL